MIRHWRLTDMINSDILISCTPEQFVAAISNARVVTGVLLWKRLKEGPSCDDAPSTAEPLKEEQ